MPGNFDKIAPFYDPLSRVVFGTALRDSQLDTLDFIPEKATVLIIGGGTGWYLKALLQKKTIQKVVYLEASARMLQLSRKQVASMEAVHCVDFRLGTEADLANGEEFDVVITHFLLDLFPEERVKEILAKVNKALRPDGIWLCADFQHQKGFGSWMQKRLLAAMYTFFRLSCGIEARYLPDINKIFAHSGFYCNHYTPFYHKMIFSRVYKKAAYRV